MYVTSNNYVTRNRDVHNYETQNRNNFFIESKRGAFVEKNPIVAYDIESFLDSTSNCVKRL